MIKIQHEDVDIGRLISDAKRRGTGAIVVFDGIVHDDDIREIELEAYSEIAVPESEKISRVATEKFRLLHVDIVHRIGWLSIGENILIIVVSAGHRKEAYRGLPLHHRGNKGRCPDLEKRADKGWRAVGAGRAWARQRNLKRGEHSLDFSCHGSVYANPFSDIPRRTGLIDPHNRTHP